MNVIPQRVRDGFGNLIEPLAVVFIRLHIRPNLITTVGTLVVIASATAFGLGWVRPGGLLLLVSGVFDLLDGRVARRADMTTTFGAFYDSTLDRVGESALFGGIALYFLRGAGPCRRPPVSERTVIVAVEAGGAIAPAKGKLGVMLVGLGAVSTTFIAGVENVRRGTGLPIGSLSQIGTIRLGKRTEKRSPKIKEFVPLTDLQDLVFAAWDPIPDDAYGAARKAGVLDTPHLEPIADFLKGIKPLPAAFDQNYVKRLHGTNVKQGKTKRDLAEQLRQDIRT